MLQFQKLRRGTTDGNGQLRDYAARRGRARLRAGDPLKAEAAGDRLPTREGFQERLERRWPDRQLRPPTVVESGVPRGRDRPLGAVRLTESDTRALTGYAAWHRPRRGGHHQLDSSVFKRKHGETVIAPTMATSGFDYSALADRVGSEARSLGSDSRVIDNHVLDRASVRAGRNEPRVVAPVCELRRDGHSRRTGRSLQLPAGPSLDAIEGLHHWATNKRRTRSTRRTRGLRTFEPDDVNQAPSRFPTTRGLGPGRSPREAFLSKTTSRKTRLRRLDADTRSGHDALTWTELVAGRMPRAKSARVPRETDGRRLLELGSSPISPGAGSRLRGDRSASGGAEKSNHPRARSRRHSLEVPRSSSRLLAASASRTSHRVAERPLRGASVDGFPRSSPRSTRSAIARHPVAEVSAPPVRHDLKASAGHRRAGRSGNRFVDLVDQARSVPRDGRIDETKFCPDRLQLRPTKGCAAWRLVGDVARP